MRRFAEASGKRDLSLRRCEHSEQVSESGGARAFSLAFGPHSLSQSPLGTGR